LPLNQPKSNKTLSLRDILYLFFKYKWTIIVFTIASTAAATLYSYTFLPRYEASSKVLVQIGNENAATTAGIIKPTAVVTMMKPSDLINSEIEKLTGRHIAEEVTRELGDLLFASKKEEPRGLWGRIKHTLKAFLSDIWVFIDNQLCDLGLKERISAREKVILAIMEGLKVQPIQNSTSIKISFRSADPSLAAQVVNTASGVYMRHRMEMQTSSSALEFFQKQADNFKMRMEQVEQALKEFKDKWHLSSLEEQRTSLIKADADFTSELKRTNVELSAEGEKLGKIKDMLKDRAIPSADGDVTIQTGIVGSLKLKLVDLRSKQMEYSWKYTDTDPIVVDIRHQIENTERELKKESIISSLPVYIDSLKSKKAKLTEINNETEAELLNLNSLEYELRRLTQDLQQNESLYKTYAEKTEEVRISQAMDSARLSNVFIIEPAYAPIIPIRTIPFIPQRIFNITLGFIVGIFCSMGIVAILEMFDHTLKSPEDVDEDLGLPVLGTISEDKYFKNFSPSFPGDSTRLRS
jgi:uncharacterized protein involved in exopolysaccharide biosynthesis